MRGSVLVPLSFVPTADGHAYFPAFPTLRRTTSPEYRMPLPLYGSGLRSLRMFAATSPTFCLSIPLTVSLVGLSTVNEMPVGGVDLDRVAVAERELEALALGLDPVADADDLQALGVAGR